MIFILSTILHGVANRIRGGGFSVDKFLDKILGFHIPFFFRGKTVFGYLTAIATYLQTSDIVLASIVGVGMFLWALDGWGAYFATGTYDESPNHYQEVPWIDWVLSYVFVNRNIKAQKSSTQWVLFPIPCRMTRPEPEAIQWATSKERRAFYETVGMSLRGLHISYLAIALAIYFQNPFLLLMVPCGMMVGVIYFVCRRVGYSGDTTALSEVFVGLWNGIVINMLIGI